jgi:ribosomal 50S subunit-associated protein YjgA (DUF615 family)
MCRRTQCSECNKPSYAGCGAHIEQVLADVPREDRCRCREAKREAKQRAAGDKPPSLLRRLFGR